MIAALIMTWMGTIYVFSSQSYDQQNLRPWLKSRIPKEWTHYFKDVKFTYEGTMINVRQNGVSELVEFVIRKLAHVVEYAFFGLLVYLLLNLLLKKRPFLVFMITMSLCLIFAAADEYHQRFVFSRTPKMGDIIIDGVGVVIGASLAAAIVAIRRRIRANKE
ncbi:VanZ family protein [Paenibacillus sp. WST5]|uniref:VanZ family protein n=1 Tax=Paenibacillus sedimenti TaxID=2770274 RepID=A0A926KL42_9BACL|nr:VanZ family protein [Paenibacillus sedimenti]